MHARPLVAPLILAITGCATITPPERVALAAAGEILVTSIVLSSQHDHPPRCPIALPRVGDHIPTPNVPCATNPGACL